MKIIVRFVHAAGFSNYSGRLGIPASYILYISSVFACMVKRLLRVDFCTKVRYVPV